MTKEEKQKAIDALKISAPVRVMTQEEFNDYIRAINRIMDLLELEPCDDAISRQAVLEHYSTGEIAHCNHISRNNLLDFIEQLPPVTPELKSGHWIDITNKHGTVIAAKCSCCKNYPKHAIKSILCPNCGAKMAERSEKE